MKDWSKPWWLGLSLIVSFVLLGEMAVAIKGYVYGRLGLDRDVILVPLWLLPCLASFWAVALSRRIAVGLSYILVLGVLGPVAHLLVGLSGGTVDFGGTAGLRVTIPIYLALGVATVGVGAVAGMLAGRGRDRASSAGRRTRQFTS